MLFYYWSPSWLVGAYDLVKLEEPAFDQAIWDELKTTDRPRRATAYPVSRVVIGANAAFATQAPQLAQFFRQYGLTSALTSQTLAQAAKRGSRPSSRRPSSSRAMARPGRAGRRRDRRQGCSRPVTPSLLPDFGKTLQDAVNRAVDAVILGVGEDLDGIARGLTAPVRLAETVLQQLSPEIAIVLVFGLGFLASRRWRFAAAMAGLVAGLALLGVWAAAMQTLALILVAVLFIVALGLPLGVAAAKLPRLSRLLTPLYDLMQTIPSFVYLIPVAMIFGLGRRRRWWRR